MKIKKLMLLTNLLLILIFSMCSNLKTVAYETELDFEGAIIAFDISHGGYHTSERDLSPIIANLTYYKNNVYLINESWSLSNETDILFLTQPDNFFTLEEKQSVKDWFSLGDKLIFGCGDSDYGGYFSSGPINEVLEFIDAQIMIDATSIEDPVFNDGSSYRAVATEYGNNATAINVSSGCEAGIVLHGPCAILGYNGSNYIDLRKEILPNVELLLSYSNFSTSIDSDVSETEKDLYAGETSYLPAVVYERIENGLNNDSHIVLAGEAIWTHYKNMYDQITENGAYNGGIHYGQLFVNNILNYFIDTQITVTTVGITAASVSFVEIMVSLLSLGVTIIFCFKRKC